MFRFSCLPLAFSLLRLLFFQLDQVALGFFNPIFTIPLRMGVKSAVGVWASRRNYIEPNPQ